MMLRRTCTFVLSCFVLAVASAALANAPACDWEPSEPETPDEREEARVRAYYREQLAQYHGILPLEADARLLMPVAGVRVEQVADTWGAPRGGGRTHEGQDIFAPRGTPIFPAAPGWIYRLETRDRGGRVVWIAGAGGRRYYYAHLHDWAEIHEGMYADTDTVIGFVGNTGNAGTTPPHLHFGIYAGSRRTCDRQVFDPLPLLVNR